MLKLIAFTIMALFAVPSFLFAQTKLPTENEPWLVRSLELIQSVQDKDVPKEILPEITPETQRQVENIAHQTRQKIFKKPAVENTGEKSRMFLFCTLGSHGDPDHIKSLVASLDSESITLVLRGLPVGTQRIDQAIKLLSALNSLGQHPPAITLDPERFQKFNVQESPTIIVEKNGQAMLRVAGVTSPEWIKRQLKMGRKGDLGTYGDIEPIAERNLLDEIRDRMKKIDWPKKKAQALKNFWDKRQWPKLPEASRDREFRYTPEFEVTANMVAPNGQIFARKGDRIEPLAQVPATFFLVVFDAGNKPQVEMAHALGQQAEGYKRVKYLATHLEPGEDGWKTKFRLEQQLQAPLYFVDDNQVRALRLENIPATVEVEGGQVVVREYRPRTGGD